MAGTWQNLTLEQEIKINGCNKEIIGYVWRANMFYQTKDKQEGYRDVCSENDKPRTLFYTFQDGTLNKIEGCEGCPFYRKIES